MQNKLNNVRNAYTTIKKGDKDITILNSENITDKNIFMDIQCNLDTAFDLSYSIMADACYIVGEKTLNEDTKDRNSLFYDDIDFLADADSISNVYTSTQLSYLSQHNQIEISELMKDEAITSIAQACSIWYSQKVAEACEALKEYIIK
jgi:hypothetical protein